MKEDIRFVPCVIIGPDGISREGWELFKDNESLGRATKKKELMDYHRRKKNWGKQSFHWRDRPNNGMPLLTENKSIH